MDLPVAYDICPAESLQVRIEEHVLRWSVIVEFNLT